MKIALVIWFSGYGVVYDYPDSWKSCEKRMALLTKANVDATCQLYAPLVPEPFARGHQ